MHLKGHTFFAKQKGIKMPSFLHYAFCSQTPESSPCIFKLNNNFEIQIKLSITRVEHGNTFHLNYIPLLHS